MSDSPDRIAETDALFKLGRWVYAAAVIGIGCLLNKEREAHGHIWTIALLLTITHCGDLFIAWLRLRQQNGLLAAALKGKK